MFHKIIPKEGWIRNVYPGSGFHHPGSRVKTAPDSGSDKEFKIFNPKNMLSEPGFFNPGSRGQKTVDDFGSGSATISYFFLQTQIFYLLLPGITNVRLGESL
jgi:hypothetical protein